MKLTSLGLVALTALGIVATGCQRNESDISPDGSTFAVVAKDGLRLRPTSGGPERLVAKGHVASPTFSPDSRKIALWQDGQAAIYDSATQSLSKLPARLDPPYVWRRDGSELLGWRTKEEAAVYHFGSKSLVRTYKAPWTSNVLWLPGGRDFALGYSDHVSIFQRGLRHDVGSTLGGVYEIGFDPSANRLLWVEGYTDPEQEQILEGRIRLRSYDLQTGALAIVREDTVTHLLGVDRFALPVTVAFSPDGESFAMAVAVESGEKGQWQRFVPLYRRLIAHPGDKKLEREVSDAVRKLKFRQVIATLPLSGGEAKVIQRSEGDNLPERMIWAESGSQLALLYPNDTKALPLR